MKAALVRLFDRLRPSFHGPDARYGWAWPLFEGAETFLLTPAEKTEQGAHVRDRMDMKRLMIFVVYALLPCILAGWYNIGRQAFVAEGVPDWSVLDAILRGGWHMLPIIVTSYAVGGAAELVFCIVRKHEINEGFLVTGILFPLTLPPTTPLWMVALGIAFGVIIGKEVFGGVGMNVLNPALTARAFVFFAYPAAMSGAKVWDVAGKPWPPFGPTHAVIDGYTGATPLLAVASADPGPNAVHALDAAGWSLWDLAMGNIPGSMGEVSAVAALIGAVFLIVTGIASWRIMVGCVIGLVLGALLINGFAGPTSPAMWYLPPQYHLVMGGFAFGAVFMATDPVSGSATQIGRWIYGIAIGVLCVLIRAVNPAYPEGVMLAILFMNVFAPLIDYYVVRAATRRRAARLAA
ncbi:MAG: NADH:ubiquinone reductase (Na(+)-transporting) subunit B [Myxococcota bacterium]